MLDFLEIYYYCTVECNLASSVFHFFIDPLFSCTLLYKSDFCQKIQFQSNFSFDEIPSFIALFLALCLTLLALLVVQYS